eukprot:CAMPEP_0173237842 /NCGR_PEP_ID=MMETSP1142-20121109/12289_1 /TAXON_ID=483371 /ORGANISM="non described non described, Strain CCMP2298" /LENGTH=140 /DNA_ID=CAMNT_0014168605 /DNA_START=53 /DNA_END=476 /DNA_ORIENTATION=+
MCSPSSSCSSSSAAWTWGPPRPPSAAHATHSQAAARTGAPTAVSGVRGACVGRHIPLCCAFGGRGREGVAEVRQTRGGGGGGGGGTGAALVQVAKFGEAARDGKEEEGVDIDMPPLPPLPPLPTVSCDGLAQALFFSKGL